MKQIQLDVSSWDWKFTDGKLQFIKGAYRVAQHNRQSLNMWFKEYFLDLSQGVPYYEYFLVKNPDIIRITEELKKAIYRDTEVTSIDKLILDLGDEDDDAGSRHLKITYAVSTATETGIENTLEVL